MREAKPRLSLREIALRNARAAADVDLLESGWRPDARTLGTAPRLEDWAQTLYPGTSQLAYTGRVTGHPRIPDGRVMTSPVIAGGPGWIRTESRFYALGAKSEAKPGETIAELLARIQATRPPDDASPPATAPAGYQPPEWKEDDDALPSPKGK